MIGINDEFNLSETIVDGSTPISGLALGAFHLFNTKTMEEIIAELDTVNNAVKAYKEQTLAIFANDPKNSEHWNEYINERHVAVIALVNHYYAVNNFVNHTPDDETAVNEAINFLMASPVGNMIIHALSYHDMPEPHAYIYNSMNDWAQDQAVDWSNVIQ